MAHMMKHTKASCGHMFAHYERAAININNDNLDRSKSGLNYNLASHQQLDQGDFIRKRCSQVHMQNRKDINVMVSWVVTVPKDLPADEHYIFFKSAYEFLQKRYGSENVVSAWVHNDEITPHLHYAFVPVVYDANKERYKVSAKIAVNRQDLKSFHQDLESYVSKELGHQVNILNEATRDGNKSIAELKRNSAQAKILEATQEASKIVSEAQKAAEGILNNIAPVKAEYEAKKAYVEQVDELSQVSYMYPPEVELVEKGFFNKTQKVVVPKDMWEARHVSVNEKNYLKNATEKFEEKISEFQKTATGKRLDTLEREIKELKKNCTSLVLEKYELDKELRKSKIILHCMKETIRELPEDVQKLFREKYREVVHDRSNDIER